MEKKYENREKQNSMSKNVLGRGFDSLIPANFAIGDVVAPGEQIKQLDVSLLVTNPDQPRKSFDEKAINELAESINRHGIIQPLVVTPYKEKFRIVAGERRYRASLAIGMKKIPAIVRKHEELEELEIALIENVQRVDLSPLEQAVSIARLRDQFSLTPKEIANKLGKAETTISNSIRLLQLPNEAVVAMQKNEISEGHARTILSLKTDKKAQLDLLNKIIAQKLSVREAEKLVQSVKGTQRITKEKTVDPEVQKVVSTIRGSLAGKVRIKEKANGAGTLLISYKSINELQKYIDQLKK